jgi:hypothetical protein
MAGLRTVYESSREASFTRQRLHWKGVSTRLHKALLNVVRREATYFAIYFLRVDKPES